MILAKTDQKLIQWLKQLKMGLDALKCIKMYISQKGQTNTKNGKK